MIRTKTEMTRDLKREIMKVAASQLQIRSATLELLDFCNLNCAYCYVRESYKCILDIEVGFRILQQLHDEGCLWLLLTGGEPLLHPQFKEIYKRAHELGFIVTVFTNGTLISPEICELFRECPPEKIEITLYGYDEKSYDTFVNVRGAFKLFEKGIDMLCKCNIRPVLKFTLTKENIKYWNKLKDYCQERNLDYRCDDLVIPRLDRKNVACQGLRLDPHTAHEKMMEEKLYIEGLKKKQIDDDVHKNNLYVCGAGKNSVVIDANGMMYPCILERRLSYDLSGEAKIKDGQRYILNLMEGYLPPSSKCTDCKYKPFCRYCPARFALETGSSTVPPAWYCQYGEIVYDTIQKMMDGEPS